MVYYFAQNATIAAKKSDSSTYEIVGAAQEVSFEMNFEDVKLYQFGSVKRADAARHSLSIPVTVKLAKFGNPNESGTGDWFWKVLNGAGWLTASTGKKITINDSSSFPMFKISGEFRPTDGSGAKVYIEAVDVYFKTFQWGGNIGEYIMENLQGEGADINFYTSSSQVEGWTTVSALAVSSPTGDISIAEGGNTNITLNKTGEPYIASSNTNVVECEWVSSGSSGAGNIKATAKSGGSGINEGKAYIFANLGTETISIPITVTASSNED